MSPNARGWRASPRAPTSTPPTARRPAALASIPYLDPIVRKLIELGYERALRTALLGDSVRLGQDQLPRVWALHHEAFHVLDVEPLPALYLTQFPFANAAAIGAGTPLVLLNSELVTLLDDAGLRAVLAHEAGHILADHVLYRTALVILLSATPLRGPLVALPLAAVRLALGEWFRAAELSADRAAALVTRDPLAVCRTLMVLAGGAAAPELDLAAFLRQAQEYDESGNGLDWLSRRGLELRGGHPLAVRRVKELMAWVRGGEYDRIIGGEYTRRERSRRRARRPPTPPTTTPSASRASHATPASSSRPPASRSASGCGPAATSCAARTRASHRSGRRPRARP